MTMMLKRYESISIKQQKKTRKHKEEKTPLTGWNIIIRTRCCWVDRDAKNFLRTKQHKTISNRPPPSSTTRPTRKPLYGKVHGTISRRTTMIRSHTLQHVHKVHTHREKIASSDGYLAREEFQCWASQHIPIRRRGENRRRFLRESRKSIGGYSPEQGWKKFLEWVVSCLRNADEVT